MCIAGAQLSQSAFDPMTGEVLAPDIGYAAWDAEDGYYTYQSLEPYSESTPESLTVFDQKFVGRVSGSKPQMGLGNNTCMPMKDTSVIPIYDFDLSTWMNLDDSSFSKPINAQNETNYYYSSTFFIGGTLGCPDIIAPMVPFPSPMKRDQIADRVNLWYAKATNCYNYYILNHSKMPWFTLERPESGTDDPLSVFDAERSFLNSCQPLVRGGEAADGIRGAQEIQHAAWAQNPKTSLMEKTSGFAPVYRYADFPWLDEAEYMLATGDHGWRFGNYLQRQWDIDFVTGPSGYKLVKPDCNDPNSTGPCPAFHENYTYPKINLPCIEEMQPLPPPGGPNPDPNQQAKQCETEYYSGYDSPSYPDCGPPHYDLPNKRYISPKPDRYYCPNVERITEPSHPFSPRWDFNGTDRDYSEKTSIDVPYPNTCSSECRTGYTDYNHTGNNCNQPTEDRSDYKLSHPTVQCAIVPVDILSFRQEAFDTCIMQRINYNLNAWIDADYPDPSSWNPPCKTRFWETDTISECPVKMSIQQCCHLVAKDVVPANFLKLRTCEGLRQSRCDDTTLQSDLIGLGFVPDTTPPAGLSPCIMHLESKDDNTGADTVFSEGAYKQMLAGTIKLNERTCNYTEPDEYLFSNWFQAWTKPHDPDFPSDPDEGKLIGYHMPYMRWWDTGASAGNRWHGGDFINTMGGFDTLIGVGREERNKWDAAFAKKDAEDYNADSGFVARVSQTNGAEMGRVGGWNELKAHQMWTIRRNNLFCIGRYEKLFKPGSPENFVLSKAGSGYTSVAGVQWPWPLGWRGYITDSWGDHQYATTAWGLDNALPGDIITIYENSMPQMYYVTDIGGYALPGSDDPLDANIQAVYNHNDGRYHLGSAGGSELHPTRIFVVGWDQGKFPTATGSTSSWGMGPERTIYKKKVPFNYSQDICAKTIRALTDPESTQYDCRNNAMDNSLDAGQCQSLQCQPSCNDSDYSACVLANVELDWDNAEIYRPYLTANIKRCDGSASTIGSLNPTYDYTPDVTLTAPPSGVIFQGQTQDYGTDVWAYCVNGGFDPPAHFNREYRGATTGAVTDTTLCSPEWFGCSSAAKLDIELFPFSR